MKLLIKLLLVLTVILASSSYLDSRTIDRSISGGNGAWWNPFDEGYKNVYTSVDDVTNKVVISCSGNDNKNCPTNVLNNGTPVFGEGYVSGDTETDLGTNMVDYINDQGDLGTYSGSVQFYTTISSVNYITYGSWTGDSTQVTMLIQVVEQ